MRLADHRDATSRGEDPASRRDERPIWPCAEKPERWPGHRLAEEWAACPAFAPGSDPADKTNDEKFRPRYI